MLFLDTTFRHSPSPTGLIETPRSESPVTTTAINTLKVAVLEHASQEGHLWYTSVDAVVDVLPHKGKIYYDNLFITEPGSFHTILQENTRGKLIGIFECLNGEKEEELMEYVRKNFFQRFSSELAEKNPDIRQAFLTTFHNLHEVAKEINFPTYFTCVLTYTHFETNTLYTATLGGGEAKVFRRLGERVHAIALSCVRDFEFEEQLLKESKDHQGELDELRKKGLSRGIGKNPYLNHKPLVSQLALRLGDVIVVGNNVLWKNDFTAELVKQVPSTLNLAELISPQAAALALRVKA